MKIRPRLGKGERPERCTHWQLVWELPGDGKRKQVSETFRGTKREAEARWTTVQAEIDSKGKLYVPPSKERLDAYVERWMDRHARDLKPTTADMYRSLVKTHITPCLGTVALAELTPLAIEDWLDGMMEGRTRKAVSPRVAQQARMVLGRALKDAVRLGLLPVNPVDRTLRPKHTGKKAEAFTPEELEKLFAVAKESKLLPLFQVAAYSGLRRGELLGLQWSDVDFKQGTILVRRTVAARAHGEVVQTPKTKAGERLVSLPSVGVEALKVQRKNQLQERLLAGPSWKTEDWVFATKTGGHMIPKNLYRDFVVYRDRAKVSKLPFHALRHTNVSMRLAAGIRLETISKQVGHANLGTTLDVYGHLLLEVDRNAAETLDLYLRAHGAQVSGS